MSLVAGPQDFKECPPIAATVHMGEDDDAVLTHSVSSSIGLSASPPSLESGANHKAATGTLCMVCGDTAPKDQVFRRHYSVICCEACKCFFRRTVQMNRDYKCRFGSNCAIGRNPVNMKQICQACRFGQCIKAGMKIESVKKFPRKPREDGSKKEQQKYQQKLSLKEKATQKKPRGGKESPEKMVTSNGTHASPPKIAGKAEKAESDAELEPELGDLKFNISSPESFHLLSVLDSAVPQLFNYDSLENINEKSAGSPAKAVSDGVLFRTSSNPAMVKAAGSFTVLAKGTSGGSFSNLVTARASPDGTSLLMKRSGPDINPIEIKRQRIESSSSSISPRQPVASYHMQSISQPSSMVNSPETPGNISAYNSQNTTPYATPHGTPMHSPLPSPSPSYQHLTPKFPYSSIIQTSPGGIRTGHLMQEVHVSTGGFIAPSATPPNSFSTVNPISLPGFSSQNNGIFIPGQSSTGAIFLNPSFHVLPVATPPLLPLVQFASFPQQPLRTDNQLLDSLGKSPFAIVPIRSTSKTQPELEPELPAPSLMSTDLEASRDMDDQISVGMRSAPPSARASPVLGRSKSISADSLPEAEVEEVLDSLRLRIRSMFKWAKSEVAGFEDLSPLDQKALLRRTVAELVMLGFARGSIAYEDMLLLGSTGKVIRPTNKNSGVASVASVTLQKLVVPLKVLNIDDHELSLLKEIVVFNPGSSGLRNREVVWQYRRRKHIELMEYTEKSSDPGRFGDLMCLLTPLFEVSTEVTEQLRLEQFVHEGEARIDALLLMSMINGAEETTESVADS